MNVVNSACKADNAAAILHGHYNMMPMVFQKLSHQHRINRIVENIFGNILENVVVSTLQNLNGYSHDLRYIDMTAVELLQYHSRATRMCA